MAIIKAGGYVLAAIFILALLAGGSIFISVFASIAGALIAVVVVLMFVAQGIKELAEHKTSDKSKTP